MNYNTKEQQVEKICRIMYKQLRRSGHTRQGGLAKMKSKAHAIASSASYQSLVYDWIEEKQRSVDSFQPEEKRKTHQAHQPIASMSE